VAAFISYNSVGPKGLKIIRMTDDFESTRLPSGVYFLSVRDTSGGGIKTMRVVKGN